MKLGPYAIEQDYSHYVATASNVILAVVGTASKGEVGVPTVCTSPIDLTAKFGAVSENHMALYAANFFLAQSSKVWFVRAAHNTLTNATAQIPGKDEDNDDISHAITVTSATKGSAYNGYKVIVSIADASATDEEKLYSFLVRNARGTTVESITSVKFSDIPDINGKNIKFTVVSNTATALVAGTYTLSGGTDGATDITDADYITAAKTLSTDNVDMTLLAVPGVSSPNVIVAMIDLVETRKDTLYLVDPPKGLSVDEVHAWHNGEGSYTHSKFNSSYAALYYDWQVIYDSVNANYVTVPPSVVVAPVIANSAQISEVWFAPAGLTRGIVHGVTKPMSSPDTNQVQYLYEDTNAVNCIIDDHQVGLCVFGQKTLLRDYTALNRVNVRLLMNYLKRIIVAACRSLTFEPNDRFTWNTFEDRIEPTLRNIKNHRGLYEYKIVKGESIVTDEDIDNYRMPVLILIKPTKTAEDIPIYFNITSTGADFEEILEASGITLVQG